MAKRIVYGDHAREKFSILKRHGFTVSTKQVRETVREPEKVEQGYRGRKIAQRRVTQKHVLRVMYEEGPTELKVVTFYPGRRSRYEGQV